MSASQNPQVPKFVYLVTMRLKPWRAWTRLSVSSDQLSFRFNDVSGQAQLFVTAHDAEPNADLSHGPRTWRIQNWSSKPEVVGATILIQEGSTDPISLENLLTSAEPGEIDVLCVAAVNVQADWLSHYLKSFVYSAIASMATSIGDVFRPVGPMTVTVKEENREHTDSFPIDIRVLKRQSLTEDAVTHAITHTFRSLALANLSAEKAGILSSAIRRYMTAELNMHPADRYVDYWLTCEFLTSHITKGTPHTKLAQALAPHFGLRSKKGRATIEKAFNLYELYKVRGAILHNGVEEVPASFLGSVRNIASELIRQALGLPPDEHSQLHEELRRYELGDDAGSAR